MRITPCSFCKKYIDIVSDHHPACPNLPTGTRSKWVEDTSATITDEYWMPEDQARRMCDE